MSQADSPESRQRFRSETLIALLLLIPLGVGVMFLRGTDNQPTTRKEKNSLTSSTKQTRSVTSPEILQLQALEDPGIPSRTIPARYKVLGKVDDQYAVAQDPGTGEILIQDALGSVGNNNTSVDGDRAQLAQDALNLDAYSKRMNLSPEAFNWLKKLSRTSIQLAFGTPGVPLSSQPAIKSEWVALLHHISANPEESLKHTDIMLKVDKMMQAVDTAYYHAFDPRSTSSASKSNLLAPDSPYPILMDYGTKPLLTSGTSVLTAAAPQPTLSDLTSPDGAYNFTAGLTASTTTPTTVVAGQNTAPSGTTAKQTGTTVADLYQGTLGITTTTTSPLSSTPTLTTASATNTSATGTAGTSTAGTAGTDGKDGISANGTSTSTSGGSTSRQSSDITSGGNISGSGNNVSTQINTR